MADLKKSLMKSFDEEKDSVKSRFEKAEKAFGETPVSIHPVQPSPKLKVIEQAPTEKVQRVTFSMPQIDCDLLETMRSKSITFGKPLSKSELIRVGLHALQSLDNSSFEKIISEVEKVKEGRPAFKNL